MFNFEFSSNWVLIFLIIIAVLVFVFLYSNKTNTSSENLSTIALSVNGNSFSVEVANTPKEREVGLMNRESMDENNGMLFIFDKSFIYPFWMKNTLIPLDIIWLDSDKKVVYIKEDARPCGNTIEAICKSIIPTKPALYVVEFNSGTVSKYGIKEGDEFQF